MIDLKKNENRTTRNELNWVPEYFRSKGKTLLLGRAGRSLPQTISTRFSFKETRGDSRGSRVLFSDSASTFLPESEKILKLDGEGVERLLPAKIRVGSIPIRVPFSRL
jgi:hypothetical protein